ncbi:MAG: hypothetical protein E5X07_22675 [Mesorhizobium sp.]|uniref:hypothetical protein n=1 Tax=Mesorhizobium sp. TaxID=1871066 RepID=UPI001205F0A8|nr:hypothetical protein [Mesorhizobium sp.]TIR28282.1 MAG: hypothetical protein E5X35_31345 [Mesorhizobium sp.]TIS21341.1 MAG: hypothetical protein E5X07_22675 [Mesorhizobium sp.]
MPSGSFSTVAPAPGCNGQDGDRRQSPPYDFAARFQQDSVGRIMKRMHGSESGTWFWTCHEGGARGTVATKEEAVVEVERAYTRRIVKADWR